MNCLVIAKDKLMSGSDDELVRISELSDKSASGGPEDSDTSSSEQKGGKGLLVSTIRPQKTPFAYDDMQKESHGYIVRIYIYRFSQQKSLMKNKLAKIESSSWQIYGNPEKSKGGGRKRRR